MNATHDKAENERIGVYVCHCGGNISDVVDVKAVAQAAGVDPDVVAAKDFVFMCSALLGYALLFDGLHRLLFLILIPIFGAFMVNSYLSFAATSEFKITFLGTGPTELRLALIVLNTAIILFGTVFVRKALPFALPLAGIVLGSVLTAPLGARTAHRLPVRPLKRIFALLLILLALRMAWTLQGSGN